MSTRCRELVASDEPTVISEPFLDAIVVENRQGDGRLPDSPCTDESNRSETLCEIDDLLYQFVASETGPRRWGR